MSAPLCVNIINDNVAENDESFMLKINTITLHHEIIPVHPVEAMVTIMDDECKNRNCVRSYHHILLDWLWVYSVMIAMYSHNVRMYAFYFILCV